MKMGESEIPRCQVILFMVWATLAATSVVGAVGVGIRPMRPTHSTTQPPERKIMNIVPVIYDDSHCMNGGTGYLGAFCLCPPYYTGRFCEMDLLNDTTCGALSHGEWIYRDCSLCRCDDGLLVCEWFELKGCRERARQANSGIHTRVTASRFTILFLVIVTVLISHLDATFIALR